MDPDQFRLDGGMQCTQPVDPDGRVVRAPCFPDAEMQTNADGCMLVEYQEAAQRMPVEEIAAAMSPGQATAALVNSMPPFAEIPMVMSPDDGVHSFMASTVVGLADSPTPEMRSCAAPSVAMLSTVPSSGDDLAVMRRRPSASTAMFERHHSFRDNSSTEDVVLRAQKAAASRRAKKKAKEPDVVAPPLPRNQWNLEPMDFMGAWVDSKGNSVCVYFSDAFALRLSTTLSRWPRPDVHLHIEKTPEGGWICGNSVLDVSESSQQRLTWIRKDGFTSVWTRGRP